MSVQNTIFVFIPNTLDKTNVGFLNGFTVNKDHQNAFFITRDKLSIDPTGCIGYCGMSMNISKDNWIHINYYDETLRVNKISCDNDQDYNLVFIVYDYFSFCASEIVQLATVSYGEHFERLSEALKDRKQSVETGDASNNLTGIVALKLFGVLLVVVNFVLGMLNLFPHLAQISSTFALIHRTVATLQWSLKNIVNERRVNLRVGNCLSAKCVDILVGLTVLYAAAAYEISLTNILNDSAKELITNLQQLLKFLMGSPVGLKLNHAFNNALGTFFLYHIALWRTFLLVTAPLVDTGCSVVAALATLGLSFQTALAADILTLATFHVYCIYVYAARLYGVQVQGLIALWRLFIGRKRNPLRNRVDSYQYSHHQLFIGTLAFTVLLYLLPTAMLYYLVFTTLRLIMMCTDRLLMRLQQLILNLPLYVTCLWALNSPRTRGTVHVHVADQKKHTGALTLQVTLITDSWWQCTRHTRAPVHCAQPDGAPVLDFATLVHSIALGHLL